jgi:hypothetical protein
LRDSVVRWRVQPQQQNKTGPDQASVPAGDNTGQAPVGDAGAAGTTTQSAAPPAATTAQTAAVTLSAETVESLPEWAQKLIREARTGEAATRNKATAAEQKAKEADDRLKAVLKAAGIEVDKEDPLEVAKAAKEQADQERAAARAALREASVLRVAGRDIDADGLLDSLGFLASIKEVDPSDRDALKEAIDTWVKKYPRFKIVEVTEPQAGSTSSDFSGSTTGDPGDPEDIDALRRKRRERLEAQR